MSFDGKAYKIQTLDVSAGGMKIHTDEKIDIEGKYQVSVPVSDSKAVECVYEPIRIEKSNDGGYTISGQFTYNTSHDKMVITQFCAKRNVELKNK